MCVSPLAGFCSVQFLHSYSSEHFAYEMALPTGGWVFSHQLTHEDDSPQFLWVRTYVSLGLCVFLVLFFSPFSAVYLFCPVLVGLVWFYLILHSLRYLLFLANERQK